MSDSEKPLRASEKLILLSEIEEDVAALAQRIIVLMGVCKDHPLHKQMAEQMAQAVVTLDMGVKAILYSERTGNAH